VGLTKKHYAFPFTWLPSLAGTGGRCGKKFFEGMSALVIHIYIQCQLYISYKTKVLEHVNLEKLTIYLMVQLFEGFELSSRVERDTEIA